LTLRTGQSYYFYGTFQEEGDHDRIGPEDDRLLSRAARERGISDRNSSVNTLPSCSNSTGGIRSREAPESCGS
jgi:hypothetical protein